MLIENIVIISLTTITSLALIIMIVIYLPKIKKAIKEQKDANEILKDIITDFHNRLTQQDNKILDQQVRLDILELKIDQSKVPIIQKVYNSDKEIKRSIILNENKISVEQEIERYLNPTEIHILELLMKEDQTSIQIQQKIKKSREHIARLLKKLFELNYITRSEKKKPYIYTITNKGIDILEK